MLGHNKEVDWAVGGAILGFSAGIFQLLSGTAVGWLSQPNNTDTGHNIAVLHSEDTEDVYDYEDYVLANKIETQTVLPQQFLSLKFSQIRDKVVPGHSRLQAGMRYQYTRVEQGDRERIGRCWSDVEKVSIIPQTRLVENCNFHKLISLNFPK